MSLWQTQMIEVRSTKGVRMIEADIYGCFAVHRHIERRSVAWRITHLPSGLSLDNVVGNFSAVDAAKRAAEALARRFNDAAIWAEGDAADRRERAQVVRAFVADNDLRGDIDPPPAPAPKDRSPRFNGYQAGLQ